MLDVVPFVPDHLAAARELAVAAYARARARIPALPADAVVGDLAPFAENGLGVAALDGDTLVGYLGCVGPIAGFFGPVTGTFSPLHGNATARDGAARVSERLNAAASAAWVARGIVGHSVVTYDGDASLGALFRLGLGARTVDAVRLVATPFAAAAAPDGVTYEELTGNDRLEILPLHRGLTAHLREAPAFVPVPDFDAAALGATFAARDSRVVVARAAGEVVGYLEVTADGENFVTEVPGMASICGAFVAPSHRGGGVADGLLAVLLERLRAEGYTHLGVDYEAFNLAAARYWEKHFTPYTLGVTRRIDERVLPG